MTNIKKDESTNRPIVRRITVDSIIDENQIRLEECTLVDGKRTFNDRVGEWTGHRSVYITPVDYQSALGLTPEQSKKYGWRSFKEGQVFLLGEFEVMGGKRKTYRFKVSPGRHRFVPIHTIIRKDLEELYFRALKRSD
jgi:hypothetical protein